MHISTLPILATIASLTTLAVAAPKVKSPAFFLAGDSTTAVQSAGGGGWGDGFLNTTLKKGATGKNFGHNGATTVSFRNGGDWDNVLAAAKSSLEKYSPYVTIQFGHNDQKVDKNISMADLTANLVKFVDEVRAVGATPILVTSLSRRRFTNSTGKVTENLADVTAAAKEAAVKSKANIIDLNTASTKYLNSIGADNAATYNLNPTDFTHLNAEGSVVFGNLVAQLIDAEVPALEKYVVPVKKIATALNAGKYIFPAV
ncbi:SGNH hydrolase-type esterase domain-containing protein [Boeremia exigua]|uniref:SGNH hydrolase-type esterase domain-containing protein n=1 Tax=Boeremia exigua TaxID=749465 RepID=UPI001E8E9C3D|nr:SGNH hydrolase-type esterase domain-containing protein [Boeremia exigua]KAH6637591.1 SGNH hydrolase-type esterase domain-containing protein [Boeremia exigua]